MARASIMLIAVFTVVEYRDAVCAVARVIKNDEGVRTVRYRLLAIGIRLVFKLVVLATSIRFARAFRLRRFLFRFN